MTFLDHAGQHRFGYDERGRQINIHHLAEIGHAHFYHGDPFDDPCIIDQNINHAELFFDGLNQFCDLGLVRYIGDIAVGFDTLRPIVRQCLFQMGLPPAVKGNPRAGFCQRPGNSKTDSVSAAGDKRHFTCQRKFI